MSLLAVKGLEVRYGGIRAVKGIDLHVDEGELVCLIGIYHENSFLYNSLRAYLIPGNPGFDAR